MNKIKCPHGVSPKSNCDICYKESRKKYSKRFRQSQKYREYQKEYQQSPKYKETLKRYRQSPEYKEYKKTYMKRYSQSPEYKAYKRKYQQSPKYKEYQKEYRKNYRRLHNQKVLSHAPAKPTVTGGVHGCNRIGSNEPFTAQGGGAVLETGGGFTIIHMDKITDKKD